MGRKLIDLAGRIYGKLRVIKMCSPVVISGIRTKHFWECLCECGEICVMNGDSLRASTTISCNICRFTRYSEINTTHGMSETIEHSIWRGMRNRCTNKTASGYARYGGRGITVCERWDNFKNFLEDMGPHQKGMTLERINVNGNYEPGNCK